MELSKNDLIKPFHISNDAAGEYFLICSTLRDMRQTHNYVDCTEPQETILAVGKWCVRVPQKNQA